MRIRHRSIPVSLAGTFASLAIAVFLSLLPAGVGAQHPPAPRTTSGATQEFTILIYESDAQLAARTSPQQSDAYWDAYDRFAGELAQAGVLRGGSALDEARRATVRGSGTADRAVPKARLSGYFVIEVADQAAAEMWGRKAPALASAVEVRPHRPNPHMQVKR
jgi:hypothetical protein